MMTRKLRVLQVVGRLNTGGLETVAMNIARSRDHDTVELDFLVYSKEIGAYEGEAKQIGCNVIHLNAGKNHVDHYLKLKRAIRDYGPYDLVYSHTFFNSGIVVKAAHDSGVPYTIAHAHNTMRSYDNAVSRRLFYGCMRKILNSLPSMRIACSKAAGEYVFGNDSKFTVVNNGIVTDKYRYSQSERNTIRDELGLQNSFTIGTIGRLSEAKNHSFILDVFNEIRALDSTAKLVIVGSGELKYEIEEKIERLELNDNVIMTGTRMDVPALLSSFDAFLCPSFHEGLPLSLVEAQAAGLKVFCSNNITQEVAITELVSFISLQEPPKFWAQEILSNYIVKDRSLYADIVSGNGYETSNNMERLWSIIYGITQQQEVK